jgi:hypothetical protein
MWKPKQVPWYLSIADCIFSRQIFNVVFINTHFLVLNPGPQNLSGLPGKKVFWSNLVTHGLSGFLGPEDDFVCLFLHFQKT